MSVVLVLLLLGACFVGLITLTVALAAATARVLGHEPTGDVALLRRQAGEGLRTTRQLAAERVGQLRERAASR